MSASDPDFDATGARPGQRGLPAGHAESAMTMVRSQSRRWWALAPLALSALTIGFDVTILNVALPTIATELSAGTGALQWIIDAYVLVFAGLMLPCGALGDRYGRKRLLVFGLMVLGTASPPERRWGLAPRSSPRSRWR
jgi:cyanate permease